MVEAAGGEPDADRREVEVEVSAWTRDGGRSVALRRPERGRSPELESCGDFEPRPTPVSFPQRLLLSAKTIAWRGFNPRRSWERRPAKGITARSRERSG